MATIGGRSHLRPTRKGRWVTSLFVAVCLAIPLPAAATGAFSGAITDENGDLVPDGRVEIYAEDGTLVATAEPPGPFDGYQTMELEPGTYYPLLYNGDATTFVGWFPQWYGGAPLLRSDQALGVTVVDGTVIFGIDAQLVPLFDDMFDSVFMDSIAWMQNTGITQGCRPAMYCPDDFVTRGQMAAFLVRALLLTDNGGGDLYIDDDDSIFEDAIDKLGTAGVTRGCNPPVNNRFCPDARVTRGQMAAFLVRALGYVDDGDGDLFIDDNGSVFEGAIDKLGTAGVTRGCNPPTNTRFCPNDFVTRGQMAAFLERALQAYYPLGDAPNASAYQPN